MIKNPEFLADSLLDDLSLDEISGGVCVTLPPTPTQIEIPTVSGQSPNIGNDDTQIQTDSVGGGTYGSGC